MVIMRMNVTVKRSNTAATFAAERRGGMRQLCAAVVMCFIAVRRRQYQKPTATVYVLLIKQSMAIQ